MMKRQRLKFMGTERKPSRQPPKAFDLSLQQQQKTIYHNNDKTRGTLPIYSFTSPHGHGHVKFLPYSRIAREIWWWFTPVMNTVRNRGSYLLTTSGLVWIEIYILWKYFPKKCLKKNNLKEERFRKGDFSKFRGPWSIFERKNFEI